MNVVRGPVNQPHPNSLEAFVNGFNDSGSPSPVVSSTGSPIDSPIEDVSTIGSSSRRGSIESVDSITEGSATDSPRPSSYRNSSCDRSESTYPPVTTDPVRSEHWDYLTHYESTYPPVTRVMSESIARLPGNKEPTVTRPDIDTTDSESVEDHNPIEGATEDCGMCKWNGYGYDHLNPHGLMLCIYEYDQKLPAVISKEQAEAVMCPVHKQTCLLVSAVRNGKIYDIHRILGVSSKILRVETTARTNVLSVAAQRGDKRILEILRGAVVPLNYFHQQTSDTFLRFCAF